MVAVNWQHRLAAATLLQPPKKPLLRLRLQTPAPTLNRLVVHQVMQTLPVDRLAGLFFCATEPPDHVVANPPHIVEIIDVIRLEEQVLARVGVANEKPAGCCQGMLRPVGPGLDLDILIRLAPATRVGTDRLRILTKLSEQAGQRVAGSELRNPLWPAVADDQRQMNIGAAKWSGPMPNPTTLAQAKSAGSAQDDAWIVALKRIQKHLD